MFLADEGDALDNRRCAGGDNRGIDGMMAVVVSVFFALLIEDADTPDTAHKARCRTRDAEDVPATIIGERKAVGEPLRDILGHIARIVQVAADEGIDVIREVLFLQLRELR